MLANGHKLIMDLGVDAIAHPLFTRHYDELLLGNMREDVYKLPFVDRFMLGKGLTHYDRPGRGGGALLFLPGAPARADRLFDAAVRAWGDRRPRDAFFTLGRVVHILSEMVSPIHAHAVLHWRGDGFEMLLEREHTRLRRLPLPPWPRATRTAGALVHELAVACRRFPCDRTRNLSGYLAWRLGLRARPSPETIESQVAVLVPLGGAFVAALYALFLEQVAAVEVAPGSQEEDQVAAQ
jgi:hypothetical protein